MICGDQTDDSQSPKPHNRFKSEVEPTMDEQAHEVEARRSALIRELEGEALKHEQGASCNELLVSASFYASLLFGGLAVAAGLVKSMRIPSELISLFAALATGATFLSREAKYRAIADWHYAVRDTARQLIARLNYEMPIPVTRENVAGISSEWRRVRGELGARKAAINGAPIRTEKPDVTDKS